MNAMRLLLIEDEPSAIEITRRLLGGFVSRFDATGRLQSALEMIETHDYDAVILDLQLLDSGRHETISHIREIKEKAKAPVVVMSGWPDPDLKERCLAAGAEAFVPKNNLRRIILTAIQSALKNAPEKTREPSFMEHVALLNRMLDEPSAA